MKLFHLFLLFFIFQQFGCGVGKLYTDSHEEPIPTDKVILNRHFGKWGDAYDRGKIKIRKERYKNLTGTFVEYRLIAAEGGAMRFHYQVVYELVDGYWKYVRMRNIGHM